MKNTPDMETMSGLPDPLKIAIERLSGLSMDDVTVHYNSTQPAQVQALAFTQGTEIYLAPGQEQQLPHEAWHVVQQKQGRVMPTLQMGRVAINDDSELEIEADVMGTKVSQMAPFDCLVTTSVARMRAREMTGAILIAPIQRRPSTFAVEAQPAIDLLPGETLRGVRSALRAIDVADIMGTPWTYFREALQAYIALPDGPATNQHLTLIQRVERTLAAWKLAHETANPTTVPSQDEQAKLAAAQRVERALPDELQFARPAKGLPLDINNVISTRLEFLFTDTLGDDFLNVHSTRTWTAFQQTFGNFAANLLQQDPPDASALAALEAPALIRLAGARVQTLRADVDANAKIALFAVQCQLLSRITGKALDATAALGPFAQAALLYLLDNQLTASYPRLAPDIAQRVRQENIQGVNLTEFFTRAAPTFTAGTYTTVNALTVGDQALLRAAIRASAPYAEFVAIAAVHRNPFNTGRYLPAVDEDLAARETYLLDYLEFELQEQDATGQTTQRGLEVPQIKKSDVVMAVMTIEKLAGARLARYPRFILIRKQGGHYRANADSENQFIRYDVDFEMRTGVHELGHYYENQANLDTWYSIYLLLRSRHIQKANALGKSPNATYGSSVRGAPDEPGFLGGLQGLDHQYHIEYTARYYATGHTEMMSMFSEQLIDRVKMDAMIEADPQAFAVLLKALRPEALADWPLARLGYQA